MTIVEYIQFSKPERRFYFQFNVFFNLGLKKEIIRRFCIEIIRPAKISILQRLLGIYTLWHFK